MKAKLAKSQSPEFQAAYNKAIGNGRSVVEAIVIAAEAEAEALRQFNGYTETETLAPVAVEPPPPEKRRTARASDARNDNRLRRVNVDFPLWMIEALDRESRRRGVTRQSLIKMWLAERLEARG
jgi:hypothetical protein